MESKDYRTTNADRKLGKTDFSVENIERKTRSAALQQKLFEQFGY